MNFKHFLLLFFMLSVCAVDKGLALNCFVCDSSQNPDCADLKKSKEITPEFCTLQSMVSIHSWLFELNKIAYLDTGENLDVPMVCQKVVGRRGGENVNVTARFCQIHTADSDACKILKEKVGGYDEIVECSICNTDYCNGANSQHVLSIFIMLGILQLARTIL